MLATARMPAAVWPPSTAASQATWCPCCWLLLEFLLLLAFLLLLVFLLFLSLLLLLFLLLLLSTLILAFLLLLVSLLILASLLLLVFSFSHLLLLALGAPAVVSIQNTTKNINQTMI
jgi:hypothetical protein